MHSQRNKQFGRLNLQFDCSVSDNYISCSQCRPLFLNLKMAATTLSHVNDTQPCTTGPRQINEQYFRLNLEFFCSVSDIYICNSQHIGHFEFQDGLHDTEPC